MYKLGLYYETIEKDYVALICFHSKQIMRPQSHIIEFVKQILLSINDKMKE